MPSRHAEIRAFLADDAPEDQEKDPGAIGASRSTCARVLAAMPPIPHSPFRFPVPHSEIRDRKPEIDSSLRLHEAIQQGLHDQMPAVREDE